MRPALVRKGGCEALFELALCIHARSDASADQREYVFVLPFMHVIEGTFQDFPFSRIAAVIQQHDDGGLSVADATGQFGSGHLEGSIPHQHDRPQAGIGKRCAEGGRHGKSH